MHSSSSSSSPFTKYKCQVKRKSDHLVNRSLPFYSSLSPRCGIKSEQELGSRSRQQAQLIHPYPPNSPSPASPEMAPTRSLTSHKANQTAVAAAALAPQQETESLRLVSSSVFLRETAAHSRGRSKRQQFFFEYTQRERALPRGILRSPCLLRCRSGHGWRPERGKHLRDAFLEAYLRVLEPDLLKR